MPTDSKTNLPKFPLRLMPSLRKCAELYSAKEGVSLNQFINVAVAQKVARLEHEEWTRKRKKPTPESTAAALALLNRAGGQEPEPGDEIPAEYLAARHRAAKARLKRA